MREQRRSQRDAFDRLMTAAVPAISSQTHRREAPPCDGGRWPVSAVLRPSADDPLLQGLSALTEECMAVAGPGHWWTGLPDAVHMTLRALEKFRESAAATDPAIHRYGRALERVCAETPPLEFALTGLTLTPSSIMACAVPLSDAADSLMDRYGPALREDAWLEGSSTWRDIWYLSLVHFAAPIPDPHRLINWMADRRDHEIGTFSTGTTEIIRCHYVDDDHRPRMRLETLASHAMEAASPPR